MKTGIELISEERDRQTEVEGYGPDHDEAHTAFQLSSAAACYIASAQSRWLFENTHWPHEECARFQVPELMKQFTINRKP